VNNALTFVSLILTILPLGEIIKYGEIYERTRDPISDTKQIEADLDFHPILGDI